MDARGPLLPQEPDYICMTTYPAVVFLLAGSSLRFYTKLNWRGGGNLARVCSGQWCAAVSVLN